MHGKKLTDLCIPQNRLMESVRNESFRRLIIMVVVKLHLLEELKENSERHGSTKDRFLDIETFRNLSIFFNAI